MGVSVTYECRAVVHLVYGVLAVELYNQATQESVTIHGASAPDSLAGRLVVGKSYEFTVKEKG